MTWVPLAERLKRQIVKPVRCTVVTSLQCLVVVASYTECDFPLIFGYPEVAAAKLCDWCGGSWPSSAAASMHKIKLIFLAVKNMIQRV